jgi:predicted RNA-binding protein YlqC (UPF0109 family)
MKEYIEFIVRRLVDHPDNIVVEAEDLEEKVVLRLRVAPGDVGKVIGKNGRTAQALRLLLAAVGARQKKKVVLEILD